MAFGYNNNFDIVLVARDESLDVRFNRPITNPHSHHLPAHTVNFV